MLEKRSNHRIEVDASATMQVLGSTPAAHGTAVPVRIVDASERGMRVHSDQPVSPGRAVKIELGENMFLGEVCHCAYSPANSASPYNIGIVTHQCLTGLSGLRHLLAALEPESSRRLERV